MGGGAGQDAEQEREVLPPHLPPASRGLSLRVCPTPPRPFHQEITLSRIKKIFKKKSLPPRKLPAIYSVGFYYYNFSFNPVPNKWRKRLQFYSMWCGWGWGDGFGD